MDSSYCKMCEFFNNNHCNNYKMHISYIGKIYGQNCIYFKQVKLVENTSCYECKDYIEYDQACNLHNGMEIKYPLRGCDLFTKKKTMKTITKTPVLDHGFVELLEHMGDDNSIANSARVSYQGQKPLRDNKKLINYLVRHRHLSPLEMGQVKFKIRCPIFIARQIFRHRTGKFNEISGRYSELKEEFYIPELDRYKIQSTKNKQGSGDYSMTTPENWKEAFTDQCHNAFHLYQSAIEAGMSREVARIILPLNTYTEFVFSIDLRNLMNFLKLRMDNHAQWEIQQYANAMYELIEPLFPACFDAFDNYMKGSVEFSNIEQKLFKYIFNLDDTETDNFHNGDFGVLDSFFVVNEMSEREVEEFLNKMNELIY